MSATTATEIQKRLVALGDPARVPGIERFFKTGPGQYGEGDRFLGIRVPELRRLSRALRSLPVAEALRLLDSPWHEARLLALLLLVQAYRRGDEDTRTTIFNAYLARTHRINNWDLVDVSAEHIVGAHLENRERAVLRTLAGSKSLWERRIAILATFHFIRRGEYADTLKIAKLLLDDAHDLIHKGVGWMLREVGNRDRATLEKFLERHYRRMPRTMLRYAIERFDEPERRKWMGRGPGAGREKTRRSVAPRPP